MAAAAALAGGRRAVGQRDLLRLLGNVAGEERRQCAADGDAGDGAERHRRGQPLWRVFCQVERVARNQGPPAALRGWGWGLGVGGIGWSVAVGERLWLEVSQTGQCCSMSGALVSVFVCVDRIRVA